MPENKLIPTITYVDIAGSNIEIRSVYFEPLSGQNILWYEIKQISGTSGSTSFIAGELLASVINYPSPLNTYINANGELIIIDDVDPSQYYLNSNGDVIFDDLL